MKNILTSRAEARPAFTRFHIDEPQAAAVLAASLRRHLLNIAPHRPIVLLCIGSDRSTGDSLGPLVGSGMKNIPQNLFRIYGTLEQPVHATNLQENLERIYREYEDPYVIAVDACLGHVENVGCINLCEGALKPGAGVKKDLPAVGDIHITGVVNVGGFMEFMVLQNTRLNAVMRIADVVCAGLKTLALDYRRIPIPDPTTTEARINETQAI